MILAEIRAFHRAQWRRPGVWIIAITMGGLNYLSDLSAMAPSIPLPAWWLGVYLLVVLAVNGSTVCLGPWAWLWTGERGTYPEVGRGLVQSVLFGALCCMPAMLLLVLFKSPHGLGPPETVRATLKYGFISYPTVFCLMGFALIAYHRESLAREEAEKRARAARWILLKGRINPHAFFNAMTDLAELIRKDPDRAERAAMDLSDLFRRLMRHGQNHLASLREERLLVERYLGIEALRLGTRLKVAWDWEASLDALLAPPFLLQPLVENAIKHAIALDPAGGEVRISGHREQGMAFLRVENTGGPLDPRFRKGGGLEALETRLRLAFEEDGTFLLWNTGQCTRAELQFPILQEAV